MTNDSDSSRFQKFDLEERTTRFSEAVVEFLRTLVLDAINDPIVRQLVRSATSIGANYCEADDAGTKKEFSYRISLCQRESRETKYWLRLLAKACPVQAEAMRSLWKEADELNRIFAAIHRSAAKSPSPSEPPPE